MSLQITEGENPRTLQLAKSWQPLSPTEKINQALNMFRNQPFIYTLSPPILGDDPLLMNFCLTHAKDFVSTMRLVLYISCAWQAYPHASSRGIRVVNLTQMVVTYCTPI
jgi:hypothetical protein